MRTTQQIAKHLREVHFGGNWTTVNLKDQLSDVSWQMATTAVPGLNTIAVLTYHACYYVTALLGVLRGEGLQAKDAYSFELPPLQGTQDWEQLLENCWANAEMAAKLIEQLPDDMLEDQFVDERYGTYFRNLAGVIEHLHYHLGQIVVLKKLLMEGDIR